MAVCAFVCVAMIFFVCELARVSVSAFDVSSVRVYVKVAVGTHPLPALTARQRAASIASLISSQWHLRSDEVAGETERRMKKYGRTPWICRHAYVG